MDHECNHQPTTMTTMVHGDDKEQGKRPGKGAQTTPVVVWAPGVFYFPFLCILLKFLFIFSSYIYDYPMESPHSPTTAHTAQRRSTKDQRRTTRSHDGPHRPTQDNEGPLGANVSPRRPTQRNEGLRSPT